MLKSRNLMVALILSFLFSFPVAAETFLGGAEPQADRLQSFNVTHTLLGSQEVRNIQLLADGVLPGEGRFIIKAADYALDGVETVPVSGEGFDQYTLVVLRLSEGTSFAQCVSQMHKVLQLARRYKAQPVAFYKVDGVQYGMEGADLIGIIGWKRGIDALRFAVKFRDEGRRRFRAAHQLDNDNAFVVQVVAE